MGNPTTYPAWVDIYDVSEDCRNPVLRSSLPVGVLGHEGNFSPDGNTLYISSTGARSVTAIDVSNPSVPVILWQGDFRFHGLTISEDGNRMYAADLGDPGLTILDTSEIQERVLNPEVPVVSHLTWDVVSIPQQPIPVTIDEHEYLVEMDEFSRGTSTEPDAPVGAARIIDIADETNPFVVSDLRLEVHQRANRAEQMDDPGASDELRGYAGHYCAVPTRDEPKIAACSFILSGLRVFDISDPANPTEIAYFNPPGDASSYAMSAPAFVPERNEIWYSDGDKGFSGPSGSRTTPGRLGKEPIFGRYEHVSASSCTVPACLASPTFSGRATSRACGPRSSMPTSSRPAASAKRPSGWRTPRMST